MAESPKLPGFLGRRLEPGSTEWAEAEAQLAQAESAYRPPISDADMIDFRCSPAFRDYYYSQGLTPQPSGEAPQRAVQPLLQDSPSLDTLAALSEEIGILRRQVRNTEREIGQLKRSGAERNPQTPGAPEQGDRPSVRFEV